MSGLAKQDDSTFELLDIYAKNGVAEPESRVDALATISAGRKAEGKNYPERSRDGTIYLAEHGGRAAKLEAILKESPKRLTIALPFDDLKRCIQQRFTRYSASMCEVYGDKTGLTEVVAGGERVFHPAGSPKFTELLKTCKVSTSVYFALARWVGEEGGAEFYWPDGLGFYRLRTSSRNTPANLAAALNIPRAYTGGRVAGVPLDLEISYRDTVDKTGKRQNIPVWGLTMRPPFELTSRTFVPALKQAIDGAAALHLPPPREETFDDATVDVVFADLEEPLETEGPSETELRKLRHGAHNASLTAPIFTAIKGTHLEIEGARRAWLHRLTDGSSDSLKEILDAADDPIKTGAWLLEQAITEIDRKEREMARTQRRAKAKAVDGDLKNYDAAAGVTQKQVDFLQSTVTRAEAVGLAYEDRLHFFAWAAGRKPGGWLEENKGARPEDFTALLNRVYAGPEGKRRPMTDEELTAVVAEFNAWAESDDGAAVILGA